MPLHDETKHFEFLVLETQQAGLSWRCILAKRNSFKKAYAGFNPNKVARFGKAKIEYLLDNPGIIRNVRKIEATIKNARAFLAIEEEYGSFDSFIWAFVDGKPIENAWQNASSVPVTTTLSDTVASELKKKGFAFVGSTTMYAHLQAIGIVNDHLVSCFRWKELAAMRRKGEAK